MDAGSGTTYTVAWPIQAISEGSKLVRAAVKSMALIAEGGKDFWEHRMTYEESYDWYCEWSVIQAPVTEAVVRAAGAAHDSGRGAAGQPVTVLVPGNGNCDSPVQLRAAIERFLADYESSESAAGECEEVRPECS